MTHEFLQRYTSRGTSAVPDAEIETDNVEDLLSYGLLRGIRERSVSLELRKKDDTVLAIPYALIEQFLYSPAEGVTLRAAGREIRVRGQKLNEVLPGRSLTLFSALNCQRIPWIAEQSRGRRPSSSDSTIVESITW